MLEYSLKLYVGSPLPVIFVLTMLQDLSILISRTQAVSITAEVKRYLHNIVVFLRLHRAVAGGVSAQATKHFDLLVRSVLHYPYIGILLTEADVLHLCTLLLTLLPP